MALWLGFRGLSVRIDEQYVFREAVYEVRNEVVSLGLSKRLSPGFLSPFLWF